MTLRNPPKYGQLELDYCKAYLEGGLHPLASGRGWVKYFEDLVAEEIGVNYAVACNSGTSGLHMALQACGVAVGDEVIVPGLTVVMDGYAAVHCGAKVLFCDVDPVSYTIDPSKIEALITKRTKAIITVSLQGLMADMDKILDIGKRHGIYIIDDAAQCLGGEYKGRKSGTCADITVFSFENKKHITCGSEGGMLLTNSADLAMRARKFGGLGYKHMTADAGRTSLPKEAIQNPNYQRFDTLGLNYRMNEISAAIGVAQFETFPEKLSKRVESASLFRHVIADFPELIDQKASYTHVNAQYTYSFRFPSAIKPNGWLEFYNLFRAKGGDGFYAACYPPHLEPVFTLGTTDLGYRHGTCPNAERVQQEIVQMKTNYRDIRIAENQAEILDTVLRALL